MPNEKSIFNINGTDFPLSDPNAVKFDRQQSLTNQQKAQAIANMGISDVFKGLLYRGEWLGHSLNYSEGNGFWFIPANTLTASADLPGEYQTTKEAVYAVIDLDPSDLTTSPLKRIRYLAWLESYMSGHVALKVYRRPEVSISGGGGVTVYEWENASAPVDTMKSIAIIVSGDRASMAVPVGGYAYIKNNAHGLAEGLYTNTSSAAFPTVGGTADSTVFTAVSGGGLNDFEQISINFIAGTSENYLEYTQCVKMGRLCVLSLTASVLNNATTDIVILRIPSNYAPQRIKYFAINAIIGNSIIPGIAYLRNTGELFVRGHGEGVYTGFVVWTI